MNADAFLAYHRMRILVLAGRETQDFASLQAGAGGIIDKALWLLMS